MNVTEEDKKIEGRKTKAALIGLLVIWSLAGVAWGLDTYGWQDTLLASTVIAAASAFCYLGFAIIMTCVFAFKLKDDDPNW